MKETYRRALSLVISMQYFADPAAGTNDGANGGSSEGNAGNTDKGSNAGDAGSKDDKSGKLSFDDILKKDKEYQSEFDKRVNKALETQKAKIEADAKAKADEAEKLANMNAEEKAKHEREKAEKALAEREKAVTKRELAAEAKAQLSEAGLPAELSELLNYESAETCKSSMEAVKTAFGKAVDKAVKERLKGNVPGAGSGNSGSGNTNTLKGAIRDLYSKK